jgi:hypothetical protein
MDTFIRIAAFAVGVILVVWTLSSAIRSFVLPRSDNVFLTRLVFQSLFRLFQLRLYWARTYAQRDRVMALFSPIGLLLLPVVWLACITLGYMAMFWAVGVRPWYGAFWLSGSSLLTLGFAPVDNLAQMILAFSEAMIGLGMIALLIAYLPAMYTAFTERESAVSMLEIRAGAPPSAVEMIKRMHRIKGLEYLSEVWPKWESWFVYLEQTHTSLIPLVFFRSPHTGQSWVVAAGTVLDAAALTASTLDIPRDPHADLCIRSGYLALRHIVDFFGFPHNRNPNPGDSISVTRAEFDAVCDQLIGAGVPLKPDLDQAWHDFAGWRVNYDIVLRILAGLTMAPEAPWSGDRPLRLPLRLFWRKNDQHHLLGEIYEQNRMRVDG